MCVQVALKHDAVGDGPRVGGCCIGWALDRGGMRCKTDPVSAAPVQFVYARRCCRAAYVRANEL